MTKPLKDNPAKSDNTYDPERRAFLKHASIAGGALYLAPLMLESNSSTTTEKSEENPVHHPSWPCCL